MERVTLRVPKEQVEEIEVLVENGEFVNRSEAIRAGVREVLQKHRDAGRVRPRVGGR